MNQEKTKNAAQVFYNDRWVDKEYFRAFVYKETEQKLARSYKEYENLIASGLWFDSKEKAMEVKKVVEVEVVKAPQAEVVDIKKAKARKPKHGSNS